MQQWTDRAWLAEATAWIDEHAERTGELEQSHVRPWSTALRVPTGDGDLWFKANIAELAHELAAVELLGARSPDSVPELVAADHGTGWMLMRDGGEQLRSVIERERQLEHWLSVLPLYAELQLAATPDASRLVERGVPDRSLETLAEQYASLLERLDRPGDAVHVPWAATLCEELASIGVPETIQHDDLHDNNVLTRDGSYVIFDWGDSCVTHPFLTMSVTLEGVIAWGLDDIEGAVDLQPFRDAYLEPFTAFASKAELEAALDVALRLGWICRVLTVDLYASALEGPDREKEVAGLMRRLELIPG
jgi:aminoglycoside phosphotransferase (APT) family kinase protein